MYGANGQDPRARLALELAVRGPGAPPGVNPQAPDPVAAGADTPRGVFDVPTPLGNGAPTITGIPGQGQALLGGVLPGPRPQRSPGGGPGGGAFGPAAGPGGTAGPGAPAGAPYGAAAPVGQPVGQSNIFTQHAALAAAAVPSPAAAPALAPALAPAAGPAPLAAPDAGAPVGAPGAAPVTQPIGGGLPMQLPDLSHVSGEGLANRAARNQFRMAKTVQPYLLQQLQTLLGQANQSEFSPEQRAAFLDPRTQQLEGVFGNAEAGLEQNLAARGLSDSSAMAAGQGALAGAEARARSGMIGDLFNREQEQQLQAQAGARAMLQALYSGNMKAAADIGLQLQQLKLQQEQVDAQNDPLRNLFGGLSGLAGAAGNLGWKPFG
jgi:hypothetical protein